MKVTIDLDDSVAGWIYAWAEADQITVELFIERMVTEHFQHRLGLIQE